MFFNGVTNVPRGQRLASKASSIITLVIGGVLALSGVVVGFVPVQAADEDCGSAFVPHSYGAFTQASAFVDALCEGERAGQQWWLWSLIVLGAILLVIGLARLLSAQRSAATMHSQGVYEREAEDGLPAAEQVARLADLYAQGILTADEFAAAKARALHTPT